VPEAVGPGAVPDSATVKACFWFFFRAFRKLFTTKVDVFATVVLCCAAVTRLRPVTPGSKGKPLKKPNLRRPSKVERARVRLEAAVTRLERAAAAARPAALAREFHEVEVSMEASGVAPLPRRDEVWVPARLAASAAGLEEGIRFAPAEEEAGVHGFILEGQGLPLGRLLAVAAAEQERHEGRPIYFAGVATQDQLDALAGHLPADAARLLRERIVVSNGIAADEARDRAVDKLYRQVPQDDRGMLQVTWMDFLMQDLARQIRMLLGLAGLRLAEPLDEQRALALVEAA